jgi:hypothetical protein
MVTGQIDVSGGAGSGSGAGGGGGAGGMVIVAGASLSFPAISTMIKATGGAAGTGTSSNSGGSGSVGRVRWDAPSGTAPTSDGAVARGPAFVSNSVVLSSNTLQLIGQPDTSIMFYVVDATGQQSTPAMASFNGGGSTTIEPVLSIGWNHVCAYLPLGSPGSLEAERCIDVAYLP